MRHTRFTGASSASALLVSALILSLSFARAIDAQTYPSTTDPRVGLAAGEKTGFGEVAKGMRLLSLAPKPAEFDSTEGLNFANSDLAFKGNLVYQGNFNGFSIWDVSNPASPVRLSTVACATGQGDPSIYGNLLFVSAESGGNRKDCSRNAIDDPKDRTRGVRIFDVSNPRAPRLVKNVETCKGSHTHTLIPHPTDRNILYIYVSGNGGARSPEELEGCNGGPIDDPNTSLYQLDIIRVPLNNPEAAAVISGARIFNDMTPAPRRGGGGGGRGGGGGGRAGGRGAGAAAGDTTGAGAAAGAAAAGRGRGAGGRGAVAGAAGAAAAGGRGAGTPTGPRNCHDVTSYPEMGLLAGACSSYGLLVDISNPERPVRLDAAADTNFSLWHTAVFSNDGSKVVFTDEWGGGTGAMCQATSPMELGANTVLTIGADKKMTQHAYFKMPAAQTAEENCVSHNGSLIPVPGRDIMVQGWYQGGVNVFDFTDPNKPFEMAYHDRGPLDSSRRVTGGSWGAYWYNGYIYSSEIARGLDILELLPSDMLSQNEIDAAKLVRMEQFNPQSQPKIVWPAAFPVARAYLDQLVRGNGLAAARTTTIATELTAAERLSGTARRDALTRLATALDADAGSAADAAKVRMLAAAVRALAAQ